jgi:hypothetical protein
MNNADLDRLLIEWVHADGCATRAMLEFSTPLRNSISSWLEQQTDITHKLQRHRSPSRHLDGTPSL